MTQALSRITQPTPSWVSYCGKFRVISSDDSSTAFLVQSFKGTAWTTFSEHSDWQSIKRKYGDTYTFSNLTDRHRISINEIPCLIWCSQLPPFTLNDSKPR